MISEPPPRHSVAICDDFAPFRTLIAALLEVEPDFDVRGEAGTGREAIMLCRATQPTVLLLDISMPEMDGIEAIPHLLDAAPHTQIVMLSAFDSDEIKQRAFAAGAHAYVEKGRPRDELVQAIRDRCAAAVPVAG